MVKLNLLKESFISNSGILDQRVVNALEMEALIAESGNVLTFSGKNINLFIDLGFQKDIDKLSYTFTPTTLSGLEIKYGRNSNDLFTSSPIINGDSIEVSPTESGFTYPRYWQVTHSASSGSPTTLSGLTILNNDDVVDFGASGEISSITVTPIDGVQGFGEIKEVKVFNDGTLETDIYVSIDTDSLDLDIFNRIEISPTETGTFKNINTQLSIPDQVPWEWGDFSENVSLTDDYKLRLTDINATFITFPLLTPVQFSAGVNTNSNRMFEARNSSGEEVAVINDDNLRFLFLNPRKNITFTSSNPPTVPTTTAERQGHGPAWDGNNRIYYMLNSTDQTIRYYQISTNTHHALTTVSFFARAVRHLIYNNGDLYIAGGSTTSGTTSTVGTLFKKVNVTSLVETALTDLPATPAATTIAMGYHDGYIYAKFSSTGTALRRYKISLDAWEVLADLPAGANSTIGINGATELDKVAVFLNTSLGSLYFYNPSNGQFSSVIASGLNPTTTPDSAVLMLESTLAVVQDTNVATFTRYGTAIDDIPDPILDIAISGTWISPVFKLDNTENHHRLLIDYDKTVSSFLKADSGIGVDNFEFRGSNQNPSSDNFIENFENPLDVDAFVTEALSEFSVVAVSGNALTFSHDFIDSLTTPFNRAYLYFSLPIRSFGKIQYKFWWTPSVKTVGTQNFSAFYIIPYLNTVDLGLVPDRDPDTLRRTAADWIFISLGKNGDSGGNYSAIGVNNGNTTTNYSINATAGNFYEIVFVLDWNTGDYTLYFAGSEIGFGTIPMIQMQKLEAEHAYEFYSAGDGIDNQERFRKLTINRINTDPIDDSDIAIPVHIEDPLFGRNGSLQWFPVTVNSALIPKYDYVQFRLTLRSNGVLKAPTVSSINFPIVLILSAVSPETFKSFYVRYDFPVSNNLTTTTALIKAWMATDKN